MHVIPATAADKEAWHKLRCELWSDEHVSFEDLEPMLSHPDRYGSFIARDETGSIVGFAEASVRHDYVNGCETSPVAFLEGIYVVPGRRRRGFARAMVIAIAAWGRAKGCTEFASDALLDNIDSHRMHRALGFAETERVVYFRKLL